MEGNSKLGRRCRLLLPFTMLFGLRLPFVHGRGGSAGNREDGNVIPPMLIALHSRKESSPLSGALWRVSGHRYCSRIKTWLYGKSNKGV